MSEDLSDFQAPKALTDSSAGDFSVLIAAWHAGGQEFESPWLHWIEAQSLTGFFDGLNCSAPRRKPTAWLPAKNRHQFQIFRLE